MSATTHSISGFLGQKVSDYQQLVKFRLSLTVVFSSVMAYLLGVTAMDKTALIGLAILALGGFLVTGAANTFNQIFEKDYDKLMARTANRPLAAGRMKVSEAVLAAGFMSVTGLILLAFFNPMTALIGALSLISYSFIYTPMKRVSPIAVLVGAFPGAFPVMIGWVAATGELGMEAFALFAIQFIWQFPHFWAIAWAAYEDYAKAGFYLLPDGGKRSKSSAFQALIYAIILLPVGVFPYLLGISGLWSAIVIFVLGLSFVYYAWKLYKDCTREAALKLMFSSFVYLPGSMIALVLNQV